MNLAQQKTGKVVTFTLGAISPAKINRVELFYGVSSSCPEPSLRSTPDIQPGYQVSARYNWNLETDDVFLPGIEIWWQWEIQDEAGNTLRTEPQNIVITDPGYTWQAIEQGQIKLYWTQGGLDFGKRLMDKAGRSLDRLANEAGFQAPGKIRIVIYPSNEDVLNAVPGVADWAGGVAFPKFDVVVIGISPVDPYQWAERAIPHELAHLLISQSYANCRVDPMPRWLAEGLAGFAEGKMPHEQRELVLRAVDEEQLPMLAAWSSAFPAEGNQAQLAYAHSRAVAEYLIENQGVEKMHALLGRLRDGQPIDVALRPVYGLDTASLDQAWRAAEGFGSAPERIFFTLTPSPTITRTPTPETPSPTPFRLPTLTVPVVSTMPNTSNDPVLPTGPEPGLPLFPGLVLGLLIGGLGIIAVLILRRTRSG